MFCPLTKKVLYVNISLAAPLLRAIEALPTLENKPSPVLWAKGSKQIIGIQPCTSICGWDFCYLQNYANYALGSCIYLKYR